MTTFIYKKALFYLIFEISTKNCVILITLVYIIEKLKKLNIFGNNNIQVKYMVILFSGRKDRFEREIIEILTKYGAFYISDKSVLENKNTFTIISAYKKTNINLTHGIAVFTENSERFVSQELPIGIIGVCEDKNKTALEIFKKNGIAVITCGVNSKNSITVSSINCNSLLTTLQRTVTDNKGRKIEAGEYKIKLNKEYSHFSVMASVAVLLLNGILPYEF